MAINDFLPFATGVGANVTDQATYAAASYVGTGRGSGILPSAVYNKIARQPSVIAAAMAQILADYSGADVLDDGDLATLIARFKASVSPKKTLTANLTVYVASTGNDANPGTLLSPFLTMQRAYLYLVNSVNANGFTTSIQVADAGTAYAAGIRTAPDNTMTGLRQTNTSMIEVIGNPGTPANCTISLNHIDGCFFAWGGFLKVRGFKFINAGGPALKAWGGGEIGFSSCDFGACSTFHNTTEIGGRIHPLGNYSVSGTAINHYNAASFGIIENLAPVVVTITGTPAFSSAFAEAQGAQIVTAFLTFVGATTGKRYNASVNGIIQTFGGGANYFPGNVAGTTATGGVYA